MHRIAGALLCVVVLTFAVGESWGQVVVNEILADPATDWNGDSLYSYRDDEWVEIYNSGTLTVDLSSYWLSDADSTLLFNFSGSLRAGRHKVVYGGEAVEWQRANGHSAVGLRLNNSGDTVMLWMIEPGSLSVAGKPALGEAPPFENASSALRERVSSGGAGTVLLDSYAYSSHEADDDRSTGRIPDGGAVWQIFDGLNPYGGSQEPQGNGCMPTPASHNGCPTPTAGRSWGSVKTLYR
jgi:hypothetical protein